jgi:alcohol dehydrogenase
MRANVIHQHGDLDRLVYEPNWRDPSAGAGEVVVAMRACALNYHDVFTRRGMPGIQLNLPVVPGNDAAGIVAAVGADVTEVAPGDRVLIDPIDRVAGGFLGETRDGGMAELIRVPAHMLIRLDDDIDFAAAAALPVAYGTAHRMMLTRGKIGRGETVLILGASGGVGSCCVQLAKLAGATVIACASSEDKRDRLAALGADVTLDSSTPDWVGECHRLFGRARTGLRPSAGIDVVVNFTGGDSWEPSLRVLKRDGRLLTCGATAGYDPREDLRRIWTFELNIVGSNGWQRADILALLDLVRAGALRPLLHEQRFRLEDGRAAMALLESRQVTGKLIVEP